MKIDQLREFVVLAQHLNYSTAAEQLFVTQPVLSRHIADMEAQLNVKLFSRTTQSVKLTKAGEYFLSECKKILPLYDEARSKAWLLDQGFDSNLRIGLPHYSLNDYLGPFISYFSKEQPNVNLTLLTGNPDQCLRMLYSGVVDCVLLLRLQYPNSERLIFKDLYMEPLVLLANCHHPLAGRNDLTINDIKDEVFMNITGVYRQALWSHFTNICGKYGFTPKTTNTVYSQTESSLMVLQQLNEGIIVAGKSISSNSFRNIASIDLNGKDCYFSVCQVYKPENNKPVIQEFYSCFKEHVGKTGWDSDNFYDNKLDIAT